MLLEQQRFWVDLVNAREGWTGAGDLAAAVPDGFRDFSDPPGWSQTKAYNYLVNNVELLRANHESLEAGRPLDYDMINNVLSDGILRIVDWGGTDAIREQREARAHVGERLETLVNQSRRQGLNPGTAFVRDTVERAFFYFAQYVDYRFGDPTYPEAERDRLQVRECLREGCRRLYLRTSENPLYCTETCAGADT